MSKVRVYEVAKQLNLDPKAVVTLFQQVGINDVRNHMSSVEPEAVERVKRHIEKQKTHDVVEERIHKTVIKRRAVAKPGGDAPSSPQLPTSPASSPSLEAAASTRDVPAAARSSRTLETNGNGAHETLTGGNGHAHVPAAAGSAPAIPAAPSSRSVQKDVMVARAERDRISEREVPPAAPSSPKIATPAPASSARALKGDTRPENQTAPAVPAEKPSAKKLVPAAPKSAPSVAAAETANETSREALHVEAEPTEARREAAAAPAAAAHADEAPASAQAAPASAPPQSAPAPQSSAAPPSTATESERAAAAPVRAPSAAPKTGVEYWTGRPGVPMPTPMNAPRTGIGGGSVGSGARRVQYDPRAGTGTGPRPGGGLPMRGGPQMRGGGPMGRGGQMGRGRFGQIPMRKPSGIVSTKEMSEHKKVIRIEENITLQGMAQKMSLKSTELLMRLLGMGMTGVHINTTLDADTAKILAGEFGWEVEDMAVSEEDSLAAARGEQPTTASVAPGAPGAVAGEAAPVVIDENMITRPPVVTVMGHVDHGKTSLLDKIRKANVASGEAGGITQHIGAYKVQTPSGTIVFLDTPGHEAFTQMRARGASVTDLVILVVAADDGVMPQTKEAVNHAKAAKVPIIVAVNKIDKPNAEPERARRELVELGLQPEDWGGDTIFVNVSAQTGEGIPHLLEMIGLQAEVLDLRANPKKAAAGTVIEALLDRGRGPVARILVQDGTLKVGDFVLAGPGFGKVRAMTNEHGKAVHEAGPSTPVEILGLSDVPGAGDPVHAVKDAKKAQEIAESRKGKMAKSLIPATAKVSLEELSKRISDSDMQELRLVIKGDVQGSVEAVAETLAKLSTEKVRLSIVHAGVGAITEGDVNLAIAAKAIVIGFNVRPAGKASAHAEENKVEIRLYSIIYNAIDDVKKAMEGLLPALLVEKSIGRAEIRQIFTIKNQTIAGSYVTQGLLKRNANVRVWRDNNVVWNGKFAALKRFKDDVKDVAEGFECGISFDGWSEAKELDQVECIEIEEVKQKL